MSSRSQPFRRNGVTFCRARSQPQLFNTRGYRILSAWPRFRSRLNFSARDSSWPSWLGPRSRLHVHLAARNTWRFVTLSAQSKVSTSPSPSSMRWFMAQSKVWTSLYVLVC